jgi:nucleotide-binding universal stress UspA family protein
LVAVEAVVALVAAKTWTRWRRGHGPPTLAVLMARWGLLGVPRDALDAFDVEAEQLDAIERALDRAQELAELDDAPSGLIAMQCAQFHRTGANFIDREDIELEPRPSTLFERIKRAAAALGDSETVDASALEAEIRALRQELADMRAEAAAESRRSTRRFWIGTALGIVGLALAVAGIALTL